MNELTAFHSPNAINALDSREVAEMVGKQHKELLRDIRGYIEALSKSTERNFAPSDFFIESTYQDSTGRTLPCYLVTRKGCEMVANKLTGEKGVIFTARYINRFHDLERHQTPQTYLDALKALVVSEEAKQTALADRERLQIELDGSRQWYSIKRVASLNGVPWKTFKWRRLKEASMRMGAPPRKIFDANYGEVNVYHQSVWERIYPDYEL